MLLNADYISIFIQKFVKIEPGVLELFKHVAGVQFFGTQLYSYVATSFFLIQFHCWLFRYFLPCCIDSYFTSLADVPVL